MGFLLKMTLRWLRVSNIPTWVHLAHMISALRFEKRWPWKHRVGCRWSQLRKAACATEMCFSSSDFSDSSFHPASNPQCLAWQDPLPFSRLYTRRSLKAVFIDTAATANQIYLFGLRGKRLDCWFVHHECARLKEESKITENERGKARDGEGYGTAVIKMLLFFLWHF